MPVTRRALLAGGAALGLAGGLASCTSSPSPTRSASADARAAITMLEGQWLRVLSGPGDAAPALAVTRSVHERQLQALSLPAGRRWAPPANAPAIGATLQAVVQGETDLVGRLRGLALSTSDSSLARLLAAVGASCAQQAQLLRAWS